MILDLLIDKDVENQLRSYYVMRVSAVTASAFALARTDQIWDTLNPINGSLLQPILRPRVPGTTGSVEVQEHIASALHSAGWTVKRERFVAQTPLGQVPMSNLVASKSHGSRPARRTLAAHYDSKRLPEGFIGATDSAVPCAILLWLAQNARGDYDLTFFDGEEAFVEWTDTDSIYGSRFHAAHSPLPRELVLLDLIGHNGPPIPAWYRNTVNEHQRLVNINRNLYSKSSVRRKVVDGDVTAYSGMISDDQVPFVQRNVPVLHLIPSTFPPFWHTAGDTADILDYDTIETWAILLKTWLEEDFTVKDEL